MDFIIESPTPRFTVYIVVVRIKYLVLGRVEGTYIRPVVLGYTT